MTKLLRLPSVKDLTGLSRSSIYQKIADGSFPSPVRLGSRAVGWLDEEIDQWIKGRVELTRTTGGRHV